MTGGPTGPDSGSCSEWRYNASDCAPPDPCDVHGDCDACTADSGCGWCDSSYACMTGTASGPSSGSCSVWDYYAADCAPPPDPCDVHLDCGTCTADSGCGWCDSSYTCMTGTASGPSSGSCSVWDYYASDCAPPPDPCNDFYTCATCTAESGCGFCYDDYSCLTGTSSGPAAGSCTDWAYYSTAC
jgi:hypothetical protein